MSSLKNKIGIIEKNVRITPADKALQIKVHGAGAQRVTGEAAEVDSVLVAHAQNVIDENKVDFSIVAAPLLEKMVEIISQIQKDPRYTTQQKADIIQPVMEIKAAAKMFKYDLVTKISAITLNFLEHIEAFDSDAFRVTVAHHRIVSLLIDQNMTGDGGGYGEKLRLELEDACCRYVKRSPQSPNAM